MLSAASRRMGEAQIVNLTLLAWVRTIIKYTRPARVYWCDGTENERAELMKLNIGPPLEPSPAIHFTASEPANATTFVSTLCSADAGPTNRWISRGEAQSRVWPLFNDAMRNRTMYIVPYIMGQAHSPFSCVGVELTDSPDWVFRLGLVTRIGKVALSQLGNTNIFTRGLHTLGDPSTTKPLVVHFPDDAEVWSMGPANVLADKKLHTLRIPSVLARDNGWLAEHMSLLGLTNPKGQTQYIAAAVSGARARAELAGIVPSLPGWKVESLSSDVCWMYPKDDGQLWAINPELGVFDNMKNSSSGLAASLAEAPPSEHKGLPGLDERAQGVPISAIILCCAGRDSSPLIYEARTWQYGVFIGATLVSEVDGSDMPSCNPMMMRDFCGYNMGSYLDHWLSVGRRLVRPPPIFHINWFRTSSDGRPLWPGAGENIRVLKWVLERVNGTASAQSNPLGYIPTAGSLDIARFDLPEDRLMHALSGDSSALLDQASRSLAFLGQFRDRLPAALVAEYLSLVRRLKQALH